MWSYKGNRKYLYISERINGDVHSHYYGSGPEAEAIARETELKRQQRRLELERVRNDLFDYQQTLADLSTHERSLDTCLKLLCQATLIGEGFYLYQREWRRRNKRST